MQLLPVAMASNLYPWYLCSFLSKLQHESDGDSRTYDRNSIRPAILRSQHVRSRAAVSKDIRPIPCQALLKGIATSNKCIATSNKCLTSNKKLLGASALLVVTGALLVVTRSY